MVARTIANGSAENTGNVAESWGEPGYRKPFKILKSLT